MKLTEMCMYHPDLFYLLSCPQLSYVAEDDGRIVGYILARM